MKIRTRLTLWYAGMLLVSLVLMSGVLYWELIHERRAFPNEPESAGKQMLDIIFFYGVPTLLLLMVGGWFLMRRTLAPLTDLAETVERVHADNLGERVPATANRDELDRLTGLFNDMMGRLENSFGQIREFTLHASHELKTPLTLMRCEVETLLRAAEVTPEQRDTLAGHLVEIQRLTRIVDSLALLARADAGTVELRKEAVRLDELLREAHEDASILGAEQDLDVRLGECAPTIVHGDRDRLRQLLLNLVENAVKYNRPQGNVTLSLRHRNGKAELTVANTGPAIPPELLPRLFERFVRGNPTADQTETGCGLGLSIAHWIVTAHQGTIEIASSPEQPIQVTVTLRQEPNATR